MARPITIHDNQSVQNYLCDYLTFNRYMEDESNPQSMRNAMNDIFNGVSRLDYGGNTRPLSVSKIFTLLSAIPKITVNAIQEATGQSERHSQRLAQALRVSSTGIQNAMIKNNATSMFEKSEPDYPHLN